MSRSRPAATLCLDAVPEASISIGCTPNHGSNKLAIGRAGEFATAPWNGWIDELRLSIGSRTEPPTRRGQRRGTDGTGTAMGFQMIARVSMDRVHPAPIVAGPGTTMTGALLLVPGPYSYNSIVYDMSEQGFYKLQNDEATTHEPTAPAGASPPQLVASNRSARIRGSHRSKLSLELLCLPAPSRG